MAIAWKTESDVIRPDLGQRVGALFTERVGGVSSGPWGGPEGIMGLNVGVHVSDNASWRSVRGAGRRLPAGTHC